MKTVAGKVHSTTSISLSKAASILSKFVSADTGASQAVCAYLRRASASFNELNQLHKELKSRRKHKTIKPDIIAEDEKPNRSVISNQQQSHPEWSRDPGRGVTDGVKSERKKHNKKKKDERIWFANPEKIEVEAVENKLRINNEEKPSQDSESNLFVETGKNKHKEKKGQVRSLEESKGSVKIEDDENVGMGSERKKQGQNGGEIVYLKEDKYKIKIEEDGDRGMKNERKKHKKHRETSGHEIGNLKENGGVVIEEKKKKKKRKSDAIQEGKEMNSEEMRFSKKKKRRKNEGLSN